MPPRALGRTRTFGVRGWLLVWIVPLLIVAALVAGMVAARGLNPPGTNALDAGDGLGDPYFPDAGGRGYDVQDYAIALTWGEAAGTLAGSTTMTAIATQDVQRFHVDFVPALSSVTVNGRAASVTVGPGTDKAVTAASVVRRGETFVTRFEYAGAPGALTGFLGESPVMRSGSELVIAGEPEASAVWFPANDHPSDAATFDLSVRVPLGREVISTGRLLSRDTDADPATATWHWRTSEPAATYLTFLAIGEFTLEESVVDGRPVVLAVSDLVSGPVRTRAWTQLRRTPEVVRGLEQRYGPYPFSDLGGVVVGVRTWWAGLECQTRPIYDTSLGDDGDWPAELLDHELAHLWFGDHVRVAQWDDIVNNEGWATFVQNDEAARRAGVDPNEAFRQAWTRTPPARWRASLTDPGLGNLFGTTYTRGGLALQALRNVLGEEQFWALARSWAQGGGARSLADFQAHVEASTGRDLDAFWAAWYEAPVAPERTPDLGWVGAP